MITDHPWAPKGGWKVTTGPCLWCDKSKELHAKFIPPPSEKDGMHRIMFWGSAIDPKTRGARDGMDALIELGALLFFGKAAILTPDKCIRTDVPIERRKIAAHLLASGKRIDPQFGHANCRICGIELGCADMVGWGFLWPEKAEHYVTEHNVWVPGLDRLIERSGN